MGWPEYTYLGLTCLGLGVALAKHGEPRNSNFNFWGSLFITAIVIFLLYMGGFFS